MLTQEIPCLPGYNYWRWSGPRRSRRARAGTPPGAAPSVRSATSRVISDIHRSAMAMEQTSQPGSTGRTLLHLCKNEFLFLVLAIVRGGFSLTKTMRNIAAPLRTTQHISTCLRPDPLEDIWRRLGKMHRVQSRYCIKSKSLAVFGCGGYVLYLLVKYSMRSS